ncbi:hypothetical protein GF373_11940 [bacterium]|nr:hypothetical protein [bacterium]
MRTGLILFTCLFVIGIIIFVVTNEPINTQPSLHVPRIEITHQSLPIMKDDVDSDRIFQFFPEEALRPQSATQETQASGQTDQGDSPKSVTGGISLQNADRQRLLALINDWRYVNFSQIGQSKQGRINQVRENKMLTVFEGDQLDNGIKVARLSGEAATLKYGEAMYHLPLAIEPDFIKEMREDPQKMRPLTPEEQQQAYEYYMRVYGHKFKAYSEGYKPPPGMKMPRQMTKEMHEKSLQKYMERYGNQYKKEGEQYKQPFPYAKNQKEQFEKYWKKYHPEKPMPSFDEIQSYQNQFGSANRFRDAESSEDQ